MDSIGQHWLEQRHKDMPQTDTGESRDRQTCHKQTLSRAKTDTDRHTLARAQTDRQTMARAEADRHATDRHWLEQRQTCHRQTDIG